MKKEVVKKIRITEKKVINKSNTSLGFVFLLNLVFALVECIGSCLTNSIALMSSAINDLGDSLTIGIFYIFEKKSLKLDNNNYNHGYLKYSLISSLFTAFVLLTGAIVIIIVSVPRLFVTKEINMVALIIFALFGIIINGYATYKTSQSNNLNEKNICMQMLSDLLCWIFILVGFIFMTVFKLPVLDAVLSLLISAYILFHVYKHMKNIYNVFMERVPDENIVNKLEVLLKDECKQIEKLEATHIWSIDGITNNISTKIIVNKKYTDKELNELKNNVKELLIKENYNISIIEIANKKEQ